MAEQFLHRAYVVTGFQQVGREGMPKRVARRGFGNAGGPYGSLNGPLDAVGQQMVPDQLSSVRRVAQLPGRKDGLPRPLTRCLRVFSAKRKWQRNPRVADLQIVFV
jgi:hypothetical protein